MFARSRSNAIPPSCGAFQHDAREGGRSSLDKLLLAGALIVAMLLASLVVLRHALTGV